MNKRWLGRHTLSAEEPLSAITKIPVLGSVYLSLGKNFENSVFLLMRQNRLSTTSSPIINVSQLVRLPLSLNMGEN